VCRDADRDSVGAEGVVNLREHWNSIYDTKTDQRVSWFEPLPAVPLRLPVRQALSAVLAASLVAGAHAQRDEAEREKFERVADVFAAMGARDGAHMADLGSADGFYTLRLAKAVGPTGVAYAVDIDQKALDRLRERAQADNIKNIHVIVGEAADPKLPADTLDAVLIRNAYHEMPEYQSVLAGVKAALKPGGVLVIIEALHDNVREKSREQQVKEHEIAPEIVEAELREAGFEILSREELFTKFTRPPPGGFWMIRARR
jgi:ubiquinone/menaquinone biosynthesis C-methylase UbiE